VTRRTLTVDRGLGTEVVGFVLSAFAIGSLGGSLLAARLALKAVGPVMLGGIVVAGVTIVLLVGAPEALIIGMALVNANILVAYISLRTMLSPDGMLGRVGATARTLSVGLMPIGSLVVGVALDAVGGDTTLAAMGALLMAAGAGFALVPTVRRARLAR
jgi:hypothetical protein